MRRREQFVPRQAGVELDKRSLIIDGLFKPLESQGFRPSFRWIARILRHELGVSIDDHELRRILEPWLRAARHNALRAQTPHLSQFHRGKEFSHNGLRAQIPHLRNSAPRSPDLPLRPKLINVASPHYHPPHTVPPNGDGRKLNDEQVAAEQAELAARFRTARELLAETERQNRLSANGKPAIEPTEAPPTGGGTE